MPLVTEKDFIPLLKLSNLPKLGSFVAKFILQITKLKKANDLYDVHCNNSAEEYLNALLDEYKIKCKIGKSDLAKIPKEGAFITISNHPLGGIDGVLLLKYLLEQRSDFKIIANFLLARMVPIKDYILPVNPFENNSKSSLKGVINALEHLRDGHPLGIFPAGEVSTIKEDNIYVDKPWEDGAIKLIKKAQVPVVPIYFHAKNSKWFYFLSKVHPVLRTLKLASELENKKKQTIHIKVGKLIPVKKINQIEDVISLNEFLREKTYLLSKTFLRRKKLLKQYKKNLKKKPKRIPDNDNKLEILNEIENLRGLKKRLFISNEYEVFFTKADVIPNLMYEIGRLRETTFRLIGEGTNKKIDTDKYDKYYHHLILWNAQKQEFVGAYRLGMGAEIFAKKGFQSFYVSEFFKFTSHMDEKLPLTIEMGRAFIVPEFQQKPKPLFLLWRGIAVVTVQNPQYKYLMGGASISNIFSDFSKSMMMEYLDTYHKNEEVSQFITAKSPYKVRLFNSEKNYLNKFIKGDVKALNKLINEVEGDKLKMPVLIKQYIKQNAKFAAYNVDKNFNDAIDALIFMEIENIPKSTIEPILKDVDIEY